MADIILRQGQSLPEGTLTRYQDQGDGTHALVVATGAVAGGSDVTDRADRLLGRTTNYDVTVNGTLGVLNAVVTLLGVQALGSAGVAISGVWVGTILAEGQLGDGVWNTIPLVDATLGNAGLSTTANGNFIIGVAGYLNVRLRMNVYTSGVATVYIEGTRAVAGVFLTRSIPFGLNPIGSILVTDQIPGVGATNLGKAEDAAHASGSTGVMLLCVRNDARVSLSANGTYGPPSVDQEARMLVIATGNKLTITQTPTITAGAYTSGDALGGLLTFAGAAALAGGRGTITKVVIVDDANKLQPIDLVLFNQTFTATGDNDVFAPSDADMQNNIGHIPIAATDYASFSANAEATKRNVGFDYTLAGTSLFGQMVIRDVGGYAAVDDLTIKITVILD